jgi:hypothetical protein
LICRSATFIAHRVYRTGVDDRSPEADVAADRLVLDALWTGVVNGWDDDVRHAKFLDHAHATGFLMEAARRYGSLREDEERGAEAKKRLAAIALLATNELYATKTPAPTKKVPTWLVAVATTVCLTLLGWAAWAFGMASR